MSQGLITAEPLYILLASLGHPDSHEYVRKKALESQRLNKSLYDLIREDKDLKSYLEKFTDLEKEIISNPAKYTGITSKKTEKVISLWKKRLKEKL